MYVLFIYTISICVSQEEPDLIGSNQQIYDLQVNKFEKKSYCRNWIFVINELCIQCNKDSCCEHITGGLNIFLWVCQSIGPWMYCVFVRACVCVCVWVCVYMYMCVLVCGSVCDIKSEYQQKVKPLFLYLNLFQYL